ncbi:MAG: zf-HC2 domain-containing protein [Vicinamibacterales bacterium]
MTDAGKPDCAAVLGGISAYLDGELEATECDAIEEHCRSCADCSEVVKGLRDTIGLCRGAVVAELPEPVKVKAQASIARLLQTGQL